MQQEVLQKLHQEKYREQMSLDEYTQKLSQGIEFAQHSGIHSENPESTNAVKLALEYNMELMVSYLMQ